MVKKHKINWHHKLFSALWAYRTLAKTATSLTPFHLLYGVKGVLPNVNLTFDTWPQVLFSEAYVADVRATSRYVASYGWGDHRFIPMVIICV
jgi:hypothetical protein|uniref:Uncharacterized protein n=1 Tax=Picea glauca TaxID=3330 RepID=A0A101M5V6_PICGL|nr:hypothetical protein ABT39_MTgene1265 [Picea glauca]QHR88272.1 hypothetical protein Q903MT_gene2285 [Picea sitchensis]